MFNSHPAPVHSSTTGVLDDSVVDTGSTVFD
jgi:hypothetical protein